MTDLPDRASSASLRPALAEDGASLRKHDGAPPLVDADETAPRELPASVVRVYTVVVLIGIVGVLLTKSPVML